MFETDDIYLDAVKDEDSSIIQSFVNNYNVAFGITETYSIVTNSTIEETKLMINGGGTRFIVKLKKTSIVIGFAHIGGNYIARTFNIMRIIDPKFHNKGYGTQLLKLLLYIGFDEMNMRKARSTVYSFNAASRKTLENVGFKLEGTLKEECYRNGNYYDVLEFGLFKEDFKNENKIT
jgi:RimJ/RimL family protein N-acetyltransferase